MSAEATHARIENVQEVLEGLCEETFALARAIEVDVVTRPGGLRDFVNRRCLPENEEACDACELLRFGQRPGAGDNGAGHFSSR